MFDAARASSPVNSELIPYWVCDGPVKVERRVPLLPYSREITRLTWLKESVAVLSTRVWTTATGRSPRLPEKSRRNVDR